MLKSLRTKWWGVALLSLINLYVIGLFSEYIISREVIKEIQIVLTLGVLVSTIYVIKLIVNFIYNYLKGEKND
jgi:Na+/H+ antiporter NhaB